jgi:hypothetical protein
VSATHVLQALFQQLLASPHWPVRHAAFDGLLARLRHNSYSSSNIVRLLPPCMRVSATEAAPAVVQVVKAHLQRQPDAQVCTAGLLRLRVCIYGISCVDVWYRW